MVAEEAANPAGAPVTTKTGVLPNLQRHGWELPSRFDVLSAIKGDQQWV